MLGARIATLRRAAGLSQGELAGRLQVSASAVGMYEQGRREPSADILVAMAEIFQVSVDYLLTGRAIGQTQCAAENAMAAVLSDTQARLDRRPTRPLSRQEAAVLFAALLMEG